MFERLNTKVQTIRDGVEIGDMQFASLKDFVGDTIKVDGFFFTKGQYGEQVVVVGNNYKINMPARCVEEFKTIKDDEELLDCLLKGHLCLENIRRKATNKGVTYIFEYADC